MNFQDIFNATAVVGGMGIAIGLLLGLAGRVFQVETDEREELVLELLPGLIVVHVDIQDATGVQQL